MTAELRKARAAMVKAERACEGAFTAIGAASRALADAGLDDAADVISREHVEQANVCDMIARVLGEMPS